MDISSLLFTCNFLLLLVLIILLLLLIIIIIITLISFSFRPHRPDFFSPLLITTPNSGHRSKSKITFIRTDLLVWVVIMGARSEEAKIYTYVLFTPNRT